MQAVILAAGESSNFWPLNNHHKSLIKIMGRPLILYTFESLKRAGLKDIIIVQGPKKDIERELGLYKEQTKGLKIRYVIQKKPEGMGEAVFQAKKLLREKFFVLGPERFEIEEYVKKMVATSKKTKSSMILLASKTAEPWLYGILECKGDKVKGLVEKPKSGTEKSDIRVRTIYFLPQKIFDYYRKTKNGQYAFEESINTYVKKNDVRIVMTEDEPPALKYPWDLFNFRRILFDKFLTNKISLTAEIAKNAVINGKVYVGENAKILEGAVVKGPCYIGADCVVGTNALVREYTNLEDNVWVGAMAEVTRSIFQRGAHTHSGFFGDSIFGKETHAGAGTVTANVRLDKQTIKVEVKNKKIDTDLHSLGAIIGEATKIGVNVSLMPGVMTGKNCAIGPHSLVRENIGDGTIFYTKQEVVSKKRDQ